MTIRNNIFLSQGAKGCIIYYVKVLKGIMGSGNWHKLFLLFIPQIGNEKRWVNDVLARKKGLGF
jgi:hypothetical protein